MLRLISLCFWLVLFSIHFNGVKAQFVPQTPYNTSVSSPEWVKMMYSDSADRAAVRSAYEDYYKARPLVKKQGHTVLQALDAQWGCSCAIDVYALSESTC